VPTSTAASANCQDLLTLGLTRSGRGPGSQGTREGIEGLVHERGEIGLAVVVRPPVDGDAEAIDSGGGQHGWADGAGVASCVPLGEFGGEQGTPAALLGKQTRSEGGRLADQPHTERHSAVWHLGKAR
jgi:hypothetical protein